MVGSSLIQQVGVDVGTVDGGVATGGPATATGEEGRVIDGPDDELAGGNTGTLNLGMTAKAEIQVRLDQQLRIDGTVGRMTQGAAFAQGLMGKGGGSCLGPMAGGAGLVRARFENGCGRFENIDAVGVMALHTIHPTFDHRMMLWQVELSPGFEMTPEAGIRFPSWIHDEASASPAGFDVLASRSVTAFATRQAFKPGAFDLQPAMRTRSKTADIIGVTVGAPLVSHIDGSGDIQGRDHRPLELST